MRLLAKCVATSFFLAAVGLVLTGSTSIQAKDKKKPELKVKVGDTAPTFESIDENGKTFKSTDFVGKKVVVLYFYPADFTGGCTKQACGFRDDYEKLSGSGVAVIGVSGDSPSTHKLFKAYHKLAFPLLADEKGELAKTFGVEVKAGGKSPTIDADGKKGTADRGVTIMRWTVVIDKAGKVADIGEVPSAENDSKRVAAIIKKLESN
jgi:peroxiredoxin Q/BCP